MSRQLSRSKKSLKVTTVAPVTGESTIKFKLEIEVELDWNRDVAGNLSESYIHSYGGLTREHVSHELFHRIADQIHNCCDNLVGTISLKSCDATPEMQAIYKGLLAEATEAKKQAEKAELEAAEARVQELKKRIAG